MQGVNQTHCRICNALLTDHISVELGIGPICRGVTNENDKVYGVQQDIMLVKPPEYGIRHDIVFERDEQRVPKADCPWTVIEHSPDGFEWGYMGSGPADFALNILNAYIPPGADGRPPVRMHSGNASETASRLHQDFKGLHVATKPEKGGKITREEIEDFLELYNIKLTQYGVEVYNTDAEMISNAE